VLFQEEDSHRAAALDESPDIDVPDESKR